MCKIADIIVLLLLGGCSYADWKKKEIPIIWLILLGITVLIFAVLNDDISIVQRAGGILIGIVLLLISKCTSEAVGYGDSWLILVIGIHLGGYRTLQMLFVASVFAGIVSLFYLWKKRWKRNATLPFVPFLCAAYIGEVFL